MSLVSRLKSLFGLNDDSPNRSDEPVGVTVERDPAIVSDRSITEKPDESMTARRSVDDAPVEARESVVTNDTEAEDRTDDADAEDTNASPVSHADTADTSGSVSEIDGIGPSYSTQLAEAGIETVSELAGADADDLAEQTGLSAKRIAGWIADATDRLEGSEDE